MNIRRLLLSLCLPAAVLTMPAAEVGDGRVTIHTEHTSLVLNAAVGSPLTTLYYGQRLQAGDLSQLAAVQTPQPTYPAYGLDCLLETALSVVHADGNMTTDLVVSGVETAADGASETTVITLSDRVYPLTVKVCYRTYADCDVMETWTEISHNEPQPVSLLQYASGCLSVRRGNVWVSHLSGSWGNECVLTNEPLTPGVLVIKNNDGVRNSQTDHAELMLSFDGCPSEGSGRVVGAALCYSGNYRLRIETHDDEYHHLIAGINEDHSAYTLQQGEVFDTPVLALSYSDEGMSGVSRRFHRWARAHRLSHGNTPRKVLLNSWEGVYFDINQEGMDEMMTDIASMGGELFVMDDGWFGDKYPRNNDSTSLGDWTADERKLPDGIGGLIDSAHERGIDFGLWIEPEMTNTLSELYEAHPDWVLKAEGRDLVTGRGGTQLVLDLSNPAVQDFVFGVVDSLMTQFPGIDYIKWDANMSVLAHGSAYLPAERQSHLYIEYHRGFERVCERVRQKYPDLTIQACASGGGRANYGVLPWFDEFWTSDNTDALQRVYIQWGTSLFFPAIAMGSHISAAPNHQTSRTIPLKYRIDVAMSGRLGMEIQPKNMTDEEKELCRRAIAEYKGIREVVQMGDIYRLVSPYDHQGVASLMYVSPEKDRAVFYWWKMEHFVNQHLPRVRMAGLDPDKMYTVHELNCIDSKPLPFEGMAFSGAYLMANGLDLPYSHRVEYSRRNDYSSRVLLLSEQP